MTSQFLATSRSRGRRRRKHPVRFGSTSLLWMPPAVSEEESDGNGDGDGSNSGNRGGKTPKQVSLTDPQAAWVTRKGVDPFFAYDVNYLIDNKVGIIIDAEGTRANRKDEIAVTQTMVDRVKHRFDLRPGRLVGDTVYGDRCC